MSKQLPTYPVLDPVTLTLLGTAVATFGMVSWYLALGTMAARTASPQKK
jgi:hypothetical protein